MGALVLAGWPQTLVRGTGSWYDPVFGLLGLQYEGGLYRIGHGCCLLIDERTGDVRYFDCGRYECPPQMSRVRDAESDPELAMSVRARFAADGALANAEEVLLALAANHGSHGEGVMLAAVLPGLDYARAYAEAKRLQPPIYPFRHVALRSVNCTRFLVRLTPFAPAPLAVRLLELSAFLSGTSPLQLVRLAAPPGPLYVVSDGRLTREPRWTDFFRGRPPVLPSPAHARREGSALAPERAPGVAPEARWLSGTAFGKWVALTAAPGLGPGEVRFRRWSGSGELDCDRVFAPAEGGVFDPARPFELGYPTHCLTCTLTQDGRAMVLQAQR